MSKTTSPTKKPLWKLLTTIRRAPPDKLAELQRLREIAFWRCWGFYAERENGISATVVRSSLRHELAALTEEHVKSNPVDAIGDGPDRVAARTKICAVWRAHTAKLHVLHDRLVAENEEYDERGGEKFLRTFREAWFVFMDADRAVMKAGGESVKEEEFFPASHDTLNVNLQELESLARNGEVS